MAAVYEAKSSRITLVRETGIVNGKPVLKSKTLNNVKAEASHQDVYDVAFALSELFSQPIVRIERTDSGRLMDLE